MFQIQDLRRKIHENILITAYSKVCIDKLPDVVVTKCNGCIIDHPSQVQHDVCILMTEQERLDTCWPDLIAEIDHESVITEWLLNLPEDTDYEEIADFFNEDYLLKVWLPKQEDKLKDSILKSDEKSYCCLCWS